MAKTSKILGSLIVFLSYSVSYLFYNSEYFIFKLIIEETEAKEVIDKIGLVYAIFLCLGLSILYYGFGRDEKDIKVKYLLYYNLSWYFGLVSTLYIFNYYFTNLVKTHKVFVSFILSSTICLLLYTYNWRKSIQ